MKYAAIQNTIYISSLCCMLCYAVMHIYALSFPFSSKPFLPFTPRPFPSSTSIILTYPANLVQGAQFKMQLVHICELSFHSPCNHFYPPRPYHPTIDLHHHQISEQSVIQCSPHLLLVGRLTRTIQNLTW